MTLPQFEKKPRRVMPIPDYQHLMIPLLKVASDGQEHTLRNAIEEVASNLNLTASDRAEMLPSGRQATFDNRIAWASTYLKKARLLESTGRGRFRITERGREILAKHADELNTDFLVRFPEFRKFRDASATRAPDEPQAISSQTPEESLESSYQTIRQQLGRTLLEQIKQSTPAFFEELVIDLLLAMGYGGSRKDAGKTIGRSGDGDVDGTIKEDRLGLDVIYVQAKRREANVGRPVVQAFAGSLDGVKAKKGVMIATSQFTDDAIEYAERIEKRIVLIDGDQLTQLMIDHGVGVTESANYSVKKVDLDYFDAD